MKRFLLIVFLILSVVAMPSCTSQYAGEIGDDPSIITIPETIPDWVLNGYKYFNVRIKTEKYFSIEKEISLDVGFAVKSTGSSGNAFIEIQAPGFNIISPKGNVTKDEFKSVYDFLFTSYPYDESQTNGVSVYQEFKLQYAAREGEFQDSGEIGILFRSPSGQSATDIIYFAANEDGVCFSRESVEAALKLLTM